MSASPLHEISTQQNLPAPVLSPSKKAVDMANDKPPKPYEKSDEELLLELAGKTSEKAGDLQNNFAKFRAERARQKKLARANKKHLKSAPKTQEQKDVLRAKFVEQVRPTRVVLHVLGFTGGLGASVRALDFVDYT